MRRVLVFVALVLFLLFMWLRRKSRCPECKKAWSLRKTGRTVQLGQRPGTQEDGLWLRIELECRECGQKMWRRDTHG